ncbi:MAG: 2-amino-4-hydroxy-6-hydroxymethyldihydropteridine diphosphokinase [Chloroflexota bacterium]
MNVSLSREGRPLRRTIRAYVGLGANVGDADATLAAAVRTVASLPGIRLCGVSRLYATRPVGVTDQPEFRNAVVAVDVARGDEAEPAALELLVDLKDIERAFGRQDRERWGPREVDLDILVFGRHRLAIDRPLEGRSLDAERDAERAVRRLEVPHRQARERLFVLAPLADLARWLVPPGWPETVERARRRRLAIEGDDAVRPIAVWDPGNDGWLQAAGWS